MTSPENYLEDINKEPLFTNLAKVLNYERVGLQILDGDYIVLEQTWYSKDGKIIKVEQGLNSPEFVTKVQESTLKTMIEESEWIKSNPIEAAMKYANKVDMPFMVRLKLLKEIVKL